MSDQNTRVPAAVTRTERRLNGLSYFELGDRLGEVRIMSPGREIVPTVVEPMRIECSESDLPEIGTQMVLVEADRPLRLEFFETVRGDAGPDGVVKVSQFWWRVRHTSNGLIVGASSEGYSSRGARDDNAALLHPDLEPVEVER